MIRGERSGGHFASVFTFAVALLAVIAGVPHGAYGATLDQEYSPTAPASKSLNSNYYGGQNFTVGLDGILTSFEVELYKTLGVTTDVDWRIETTSSGLPTGTVLASGTIANASIVTGFVAVDVSASAIPVAVGEIYAIILQGQEAFPASAIYWRAGMGTDATYTGGTALDKDPSKWRANTGDLGFRTYVPEPGRGALDLGALATLALLLRPLRRRRN